MRCDLTDTHTHTHAHTTTTVTLAAHARRGLKKCGIITDGVKSTGDKMGIVCDAHLGVGIVCDECLTCA